MKLRLGKCREEVVVLHEARRLMLAGVLAAALCEPARICDSGQPVHQALCFCTLGTLVQGTHVIWSRVAHGLYGQHSRLPAYVYVFQATAGVPKNTPVHAAACGSTPAFAFGSTIKHLSSAPEAVASTVPCLADEPLQASCSLQLLQGIVPVESD